MFRNLFSKKDKRKKRVSPSARTPQGRSQSHPLYQYAMNEYAQTVAPSVTGKQAGNDAFLASNDEYDTLKEVDGDDGNSQEVPQSNNAANNLRSRSPQQTPASNSPTQQYAMEGDINSNNTYCPPSQQEPHRDYKRPSNEPTMPDATYEEHYGDAYIGGSIKYIYPSGYQSMRPRSGPWKLSIIVCMLFTWLSVFVIGHCSGRVDQSLYQTQDIDDDTLVIETRWCGSRLLYMMWVISMLITGLTAAYCSVIGYIKLRDFAVANGRSQPPGVGDKSDYYVQIRDNLPTDTTTPHYHQTIYQADGTPQFWGGHIYRPTQAAVAVSTR